MGKGREMSLRSNVRIPPNILMAMGPFLTELSSTIHSAIVTKGTVDGSLNTGTSSELRQGPKRGIGTENEAGPGLADAGGGVVSIGTKDSIHDNDPLSAKQEVDNTSALWVNADVAMVLATVISLPPNLGELRTQQIMLLQLDDHK